MKLLLDTHTLLWFDIKPERISQAALAKIRDRKNDVYVSAITVWELGIKYRLGKLQSAQNLLDNYESTLKLYDFIPLEFKYTHALIEKDLTHSHKDPFDRALVAQAFAEQLVIVTQDSIIKTFAQIQTLW